MQLSYTSGSSYCSSDQDLGLGWYMIIVEFGSSGVGLT